MKLNLCHSSPELGEIETVVALVRDEGEARIVRASPSIFYPGGGGQPADVGRIGEFAITGTSTDKDGNILYCVAGPIDEGPALMRIDGAFRFDKRQQHTGQHLVSHLAEQRIGVKTRSFDMKSGELTLDGGAFADQELEQLEAAANEVIRRRLDVVAHVERRSDGEDHREIEITDVGRSPCGGTHLATTAELQLVLITRKKPSVLSLLMGERAIAALREGRARECELTRLTSAPTTDIVETVRRLVDAVPKHRKQAASLRSACANAWALVLNGEPDRRIVDLGDAVDEQLPRAVATSIHRVHPQRPVMVVADVDERVAWAIAVDEANAPQLADSVGCTLGAPVKGRGGIFAGVAATRERLAEATALVQAQRNGEESPRQGGRR